MGGKTPAPKHVHGGMTRPAMPGKPNMGGGKNPTPYNPGQMNSFEPWLGGQPSPGGRPGANVKSEVNLRFPVKGGVSGLRSVNPIPGGTGNPNNPYVPLKKGGAAKKTTKGMKKK